MTGSREDTTLTEEQVSVFREMESVVEKLTSKFKRVNENIRIIEKRARKDNLVGTYLSDLPYQGFRRNWDGKVDKAVREIFSVFEAYKELKYVMKQYPKINFANFFEEVATAEQNYRSVMNRLYSHIKNSASFRNSFVARAIYHHDSSLIGKLIAGEPVVLGI